MWRSFLIVLYFLLLVGPAEAARHSPPLISEHFGITLIAIPVEKKSAIRRAGDRTRASAGANQERLVGSEGPLSLEFRRRTAADCQRAGYNRL